MQIYNFLAKYTVTSIPMEKKNKTGKKKHNFKYFTHAVMSYKIFMITTSPTLIFKAVDSPFSSLAYGAWMNFSTSSPSRSTSGTSALGNTFLK